MTRQLRIEIDTQADAAYFHVSDHRVARTVEVNPYLLVDFDDEDEPVGVEMLGLASRERFQEVTSIIGPAACFPSFAEHLGGLGGSLFVQTVDHPAGILARTHLVPAMSA